MIPLDVPVAGNLLRATFTILLRVVVVIQHFVPSGSPRIPEIDPPDLLQNDPVVIDLFVRRRRLPTELTLGLLRVDLLRDGRLFLAVNDVTVGDDVGLLGSGRLFLAVDNVTVCDDVGLLGCGQLFLTVDDVTVDDDVPPQVGALGQVQVLLRFGPHHERLGPPQLAEHFRSDRGAPRFLSFSCIVRRLFVRDFHSVAMRRARAIVSDKRRVKIITFLICTLAIRVLFIWEISRNCLFCAYIPVISGPFHSQLHVRANPPRYYRD